MAMRIIQEPGGKTGRGQSVREFDTWGDYLAWVSSPKQAGSEHDASTRKGAARSDWSGSASFQEAWDLARFGWPDGRKLIDALTSQVEHLTADLVTRPTVAFDVTGDCVDVGRFLSGEPECMMHFEQEEIQGAGRVVRVRIDVAASAAVDPKDMMKRGAAALALVDCLENAGRSCEIVFTCCTEVGNSRIDNIVMLKEAGAPVEMDSLAFAIAHPSSLRRIGFAAWEHENEGLRDACGIPHGGYGKAVAPKHCPAEIIVPSMYGLNGGALLKWIEQQLKENGVTVEEK